MRGQFSTNRVFKGLARLLKTGLLFSMLVFSFSAVADGCYVTVEDIIKGLFDKGRPKAGEEVLDESTGRRGVVVAVDKETVTVRFEDNTTTTEELPMGEVQRGQDCGPSPCEGDDDSLR